MLFSFEPQAPIWNSFAALNLAVALRVSRSCARYCAPFQLICCRQEEPPGWSVGCTVSGYFDGYILDVLRAVFQCRIDVRKFAPCGAGSFSGLLEIA
jgi:hypothetical protein